ncbi:MAG TPA: serine/threonine-protein kinase [Actinomycetota bacterium]|nr:serine/threonine-protein kinase [Actinomycetota bacterium]
MAEQAGAVDGRRLGGRYRMGALLAAGGMGEVWAAHDLLLDRAVAVKLLGGALAGDGRAAERLRREARAAGRLDHPNIARVLDLGEQDGRPYLVMELLEGESLAARIDRAGAMAAPEAARVVAAVADALEAAHQAGVVHRDVKPGNVFLTSDGEVKVLDFGIASAAGEAALTTGEMLGTPAYLAPERVLGHPATPAADVYALGVVLYELLAGRRPFDEGSDIELAMAHVHAHPAPLALAAPSAPPFLVAACEQAMARDPSARPPSASTFAQLVRAKRPGPGLPATRPLPLPAAVASKVPTPPVAGRRRSRSRRRGLLVALLVAGAVLAALPVLAGGLLPWAGERLETPFVVQVPGGVTPADADPGQGSTRPGAQPSGEADPPAVADPAGGDDLQADGGDEDRARDDDSSGSGRSGGGDSGGGGSSGPG